MSPSALVARSSWAGSHAVPAAVFLLTPAILILAEKAIVPLLAGLGLFAAIDLARRGVRRALPRGLLLLAAGLLLLGLASTLWTVNLQRSLTQLGKITALVAMGLAFIAWLRAIETRETMGFLVLAAVAGTVLGALAFIVAYLDHGQARGFSVYNRPIALALLTLWPLAGLLWIQGARNEVLGLTALVVAVVALGLSDAAKLGLLLGVSVAAVAALAPRLAALLLALGIVAAALGQVLVFHGIIGSFQRPAWLPASFYHRIEIYDLAAAAIFERPWTGWGLASFRSLPVEAFDLGRYVVVQGPESHVHSNFMEAWYDLGILGFLLSLAVPLAAIAWAVKQSGALAALALGAVAAASTIAFVSYGLTQSAWIAILLWSSALWFLVESWTNAPR